MLRKDIFLRLGGLDPIFFLYQEDLDFCWRAWLAGYRVVYVPRARILHIGHYATKQAPYASLFHARKNRLVTLFTNYPLPLSLLTLSTLAMLYMGGAILALLRGNRADFYAFIKPLSWFLKHVRYAAKKRSAANRIKVRPTAELFRFRFIRLTLIGLRFHLSRLYQFF